MSKTRQTLYNILKGKFLIDENAKKTWVFVIFLAFLALLMIASSHSTDQKVIKIAELNHRNKELRSEFVATRSELMKLKMESTILEELEKKGFFSYVEPPHKIKVKIVK
jgi:ABC-type bacteriocin/lantibiotic exporter with double-glycine peptidase domain